MCVVRLHFFFIFISTDFKFMSIKSFISLFSSVQKGMFSINFNGDVAIVFSFSVILVGVCYKIDWIEFIYV